MNKKVYLILISVNTSVHFLSDKNSFLEKLCVTYALVVTLFFSLTHVTCMALHHTVVIRINNSVTYRTLCNASGHLVIYRECYGFGRAFFSLSVVFYVALLSVFLSLPWARQLNLKASMVSY